MVVEDVRVNTRCPKPTAKCQTTKRGQVARKVPCLLKHLPEVLGNQASYKPPNVTNNVKAARKVRRIAVGNHPVTARCPKPSTKCVTPKRDQVALKVPRLLMNLPDVWGNKASFKHANVTTKVKAARKIPRLVVGNIRRDKFQKTNKDKVRRDPPNPVGVGTAGGESADFGSTVKHNDSLSTISADNQDPGSFSTDIEDYLDFGTVSDVSADFGWMVEPHDCLSIISADDQGPGVFDTDSEKNTFAAAKVVSPKACKRPTDESSEHLSFAQQRCILSMYAPAKFDLATLVGDEKWHCKSADLTKVLSTYQERFKKCNMRSVDQKLEADFQELILVQEYLQQIKEDLTRQIKPLEAQRRAVSARMRGATDAKKALTKTLKQEIDLYRRIPLIMGKRGTTLAANGASTYAEVTKNSLDRLCAEMKTLGIVEPHSCIMDIGSGIGTALVHMCHRLGCNGIGIEYDPGRVFLCGSSFLKLTKACRDNPFLRTNTACFFGNILDINVLTMPDILYTYDEAFPPDVMEWLADLIVKSPRVKYVISFKAMRHLEYTGFLENKACLVLMKKVNTSKIGSGELSRAHIYRREITQSTRASDTTITPNAAVLSLETKADDFFKSNIHDRMAFYDNLVTEMGILTESKRKKNAVLAADDCGAQFWCQCSVPCGRCTIKFKHVHTRQLQTRPVNWLQGSGTTGLITTKALPEETLVIQYHGKPLTNITTSIDRRYVMEIDNRWVDARDCGKQMYVNHSCRPNCLFQKWTDRNNKEQVSLYTRRGIAMREELSVNYGTDRESFVCGICGERQCSPTGGKE